METIFIIAGVAFVASLFGVAFKQTKKNNLKKDYDNAVMKYGPLPMIKGLKISYLYGVRNTTACILIAQEDGILASYENSPQQSVVIPYKIIKKVTNEEQDLANGKNGRIEIIYDEDSQFILEYGTSESDLYFNASAAQTADFSLYVNEKIANC